MLSLAGLALSLLLPEIGRSTGADTARAVLTQDAVKLRRAEVQFRTAIRLATLDPSMPAAGAAIIGGDETALRVTPIQRNGDIPTSATFRLNDRGRGGTLVLEQKMRRETLAEWDDGDASFAYFSDGEWRRAPGLTRVEMVRLGIAGRVVWIEKLSRPPINPPEFSMRQIEGGGNLDR